MHNICLPRSIRSTGASVRWYFEDDKHGGTINDIGIHGIDLIPYLTGLSFKRTVARGRNLRAARAEVYGLGDVYQRAF